MEVMKGDGEVGDAVKESVLSRDDHCRDGWSYWHVCTMGQQHEEHEAAEQHKIPNLS
jgi:hypothetical protein